MMFFMSKEELAFAIATKYDLDDKCPCCGAELPWKAPKCHNCGRTILEWTNQGGHKVLAYEE